MDTGGPSRRDPFGEGPIFMRVLLLYQCNIDPSPKGSLRYGPTLSFIVSRRDGRLIIGCGITFYQKLVTLKVNVRHKSRLDSSH